MERHNGNNPAAMWRMSAFRKGFRPSPEQLERWNLGDRAAIAPTIIAQIADEPTEKK